MLTITLMRHAKSSWDYPHLSDLERPLNKRGLKDAAFMASLFASLRWQDSRVLVSPSRRTLDTLNFFIQASVIRKECTKIADSVYEASSGDLLELLSKQNSEHRSILVVGHNPALTNLLNLLSGLNISNLPTCGVVSLSANGGQWSDIQNYSFKLLLLLTPKSQSLCKPNALA